MAKDRRVQRCPVCNLDVGDVTVTMSTAAGRKFVKFKYLNLLDVVGPVCNIDIRWAGSQGGLRTTHLAEPKPRAGGCPSCKVRGQGYIQGKFPTKCLQ